MAPVPIRERAFPCGIVQPAFRLCARLATAAMPALGALLLLQPREAEAGRIPYWARKYNVTCSQCHVSVPRLNGFGAGFLARGYRMPPDSAVTSHRTFPLAIWVSGRSDTRPAGAATAEHVRAYLNRVEVISGGQLIAPSLSYFVEWRPVSQESQSNGTLRDRSGRFEDVFITAYIQSLSITAGQFRQLDQVDVSRRLGISEPLALAASVAGSGGGSSREQSLRAFAPSGRSPSVRVAWQRPLRAWNWTAAVALPVPGEFSIPLNEDARIAASNEVEWRTKGVFAESYIRQGAMSIGAHAFYDDSDRYLTNAVATGRMSSFYWTGVGGADKSGGVLRGRWSLEGEFIPQQFAGLGARVEDRAGDGAELAFLPYLNVNFPATQYTLRLTVERRFQKGRNGTFLELGSIF